MSDGSGALASMASRYERPAWVRRLNVMGASSGDPLAGAPALVPIDADAILASVATLLDEELPEGFDAAAPSGDFGDSAWRDDFVSLCTAVDAAPLNVVGRLVTRQELMRSLRTRFLLDRTLRAHSEIEDEPIHAPVIVTGPARSGTTILFELLALDPDLRAPLAWEALHPVEMPDGPDAATRSRLAECEQELWADIQPEFASIHELRADLPVECVTLTAPSFCGNHWSMALPGPPPPDIDRDYAFHRRLLQVLQHQDAARGEGGRTWLLKTPGHVMTLDQLLATYPDVWVVQTHRDPARTMPSTVSTTAMVQWMRTEQVDLQTLQQVISAVFSAALNSVAERRRDGALPPRFVDIHFDRMLKDPVETLRAAYGSMGREFSDAHADRIRAYLGDKPRGKFGVHRYSAHEWGFEVETLREQLAPYIE